LRFHRVDRNRRRLVDVVLPQLANLTYETDPDIIHDYLPELLELIEQPLVHYEWIKMLDSPAIALSR